MCSYTLILIMKLTLNALARTLFPIMQSHSAQVDRGNNHYTANPKQTFVKARIIIKNKSVCIALNKFLRLP